MSINTLKTKLNYTVLIILSVILFTMYSSGIREEPGLWELPDESSYIWNAAYFLNRSWDSIASIPAFYGFGYSTLLMPIFLSSKTGMQIVRGAHLLNVGCVIVFYYLVAILLNAFDGRENKKNMVIAFIGCLSPFLFVNSLKVLPECLLALCYGLTIYTFYLVLKNNLLASYIAIATTLGFMMAVHIRSIIIVVIIVLASASVIVVKKDRKSVRRLLLMLSLLAVLFIFMRIIKGSILEYKTTKFSVTSSDNEIIKNVITPSYLLKRISWIMSDSITDYGMSFLAKCFYMLYASVGMMWVIIIKAIDSIKAMIRDKKDPGAEGWTIIVITISSLTMMLASAANGIGRGDIRYVFYGRYYEFTLPVIVCVGLYLFLQNRKTGKRFLVCGGFTASVGLLVTDWVGRQNIDLEAGSHIDTARLSAFSHPAMRTHTWREMLFLITIVAASECVIYYMLLWINCRQRMVLSFTIVVAGLLFNSYEGVRSVIQKQESLHSDVMLAKQASEKCVEDGCGIVFLEDHSFYTYYYSGMQVIMKDLNVQVIDVEKNPSLFEERSSPEGGELLLVYKTSQYSAETEQNCNKLGESAHYILYERW